MGYRMTSIAILCLLLLERFLASDMDDYTEPVLSGLRTLEKAALKHTRNVLPPDILTKHRKLSKFYLFTPEFISDGHRLDMESQQGFQYFNPHLETKVIIHGFLDKVKIADWIHHMKDEFLFLDNFNVIVVDWSSGNFIPYTKAAANTEQVGEEIAALLKLLQDKYGANPAKFHLLGHSLGSHVAGYVGEKIKGLKRITGLDPATYLFSNVSPRGKLDKSDATFVDVVHTDGGGIGMIEPVGDVDFYPNGGQVQPGCTASNSLRSLLENGVVEGVRNIICSHMRAPLVFTETINARHCQMLAHECLSWDEFVSGKCESCLSSGKKCATLGYHMDINRDYGNGTKYFLFTSDSPPYCVYEYKITVERLTESSKSSRQVFSSMWRRSEWSSSDVLHVTVYGSSGTTEFKLEGNNDGWQGSRVVFSHVYLGDILGAIIRWNKKPITRTKVVSMISNVISRDAALPFIHKIKVSCMKGPSQWKSEPTVFELCVSPVLSNEQIQKGSTFRRDYC